MSRLCRLANKFLMFLIAMWMSSSSESVVAATGQHLMYCFASTHHDYSPLEPHLLCWFPLASFVIIIVKLVHASIASLETTCRLCMLVVKGASLWGWVDSSGAKESCRDRVRTDILIMHEDDLPRQLKDRSMHRTQWLFCKAMRFVEGL